MQIPSKSESKKLAQNFDLRLLLLFGSRATGETHRQSDVDFAFLSKKKLTARQEVLLNTRLCKLVGTDKIDTVNLKRAHPLLLKEILEFSKILYQTSPLEFSKFEVLVLQKYQEAIPLFKMRRERLEKLVNSYD